METVNVDHPGTIGNSEKLQKSSSKDNVSQLFAMDILLLPSKFVFFH